MQRGDRVRLTVRAAHSPAGCRIDWSNRRGTVVFTPRPASGCVSVQWDDRRTPEPVPKGMVELVVQEEEIS